jgi:hypothetical protein
MWNLVLTGVQITPASVMTTASMAGTVMLDQQGPTMTEILRGYINEALGGLITANDYPSSSEGRIAVNCPSIID